MNYTPYLTLLLAVLLTATGRAQSVTTDNTANSSQLPANRKTVAVAKPGGGRLIFEQIPPPVRIPTAVPAAVPAIPAMTPEQRAARRAAWLEKAPHQTLILPITATVYPGSVTHLAWRAPNAAGTWSDMEAWTRTDYSSLHVVSDIERDRIRYCVFANVVDGTLRYAGRRTVPAPGSLPANGALVLLKGDPADASALAPIHALHDHYVKNAPQLTTAWQARLAAAREEEERKRTTLPTDTVIRFYAIPDEPISRKPAATVQPTIPAAE